MCWEWPVDAKGRRVSGTTANAQSEGCGGSPVCSLNWSKNSARKRAERKTTREVAPQKGRERGEPLWVRSGVCNALDAIVESCGQSSCFCSSPVETLEKKVVASVTDSWSRMVKWSTADDEAFGCGVWRADSFNSCIHTSTIVCLILGRRMYAISLRAQPASSSTLNSLFGGP